MEQVQVWLGAFAALWTTPFYYAALLLVAVLLYRQTAIERKLFAVKLHAWWDELWRALLWGALAGLAASAVFLFAGAALTLPGLILLWSAALLLSILRIRFMCFAYAAGVIGLLQAALSWTDAAALPELSAVLVREIQAVHLPSLFLLVGVLHLAEAVLVRFTAARLATPLFFDGKRGKAVGGYRIQAVWPVPLLLLAPLGAALGGAQEALPWPTLFGTGGGSAGWTAIAFPVLIGYRSLSLAQGPWAKVKSGFWSLAGYGVIVAGAGIALFYVPLWWTAAIVSLLCFGLHELLLWLDRRQETSQPPYFVHDVRGLKVLAVIPGSPAQALGIQPGYIVRKVNGIPVRDRAELHAAMRMNAAFVKLEVLDREGENRFMQRALYANEHHQLGIVLCPDDRTMFVAENVEGGLFSFLRARRSSGGGLGADASHPRLALMPPKDGSGPDNTASM